MAGILADSSNLNDQALNKMKPSFRRFDCPACLRALTTGQTKRRDQQPMRCRTQRAFLKPRSTAPSSVHATPDPLRSASGFRTPVQCVVICTSVRQFCDVQLNEISGGFLEWESRSFCLDTIPLDR